MNRRQFTSSALLTSAAAALPGIAFAQTGAASSPAATLANLRTFKLAIPQAKLDLIERQLRDAELAPAMLADGWSTGMSVKWLAALRAHWLDRFDWRAIESRLNRHPQFLADVGGTTLHFYHVEGKGPNPRPVLLAHGWPYSIYAFADVIDRLTDPVRFGGRAEDALTIVAPSMPGYAFSPATNPPTGPLGTVRLYRTLMQDVLGYPRFGLQGGDIGSLIGVYMARDFAPAMTGLHLNLGPESGPPKNGQMSAEEKEWRERGAAYLAAEFDYMRAQANKPMMVGAALQASPLATAAWIAEKFWSWTDHGGHLDQVISKDKLLTEVMAYVATDSIASSFGMYRMIRDELQFQFHPGGRIPVPTGLYLGPEEYIFANPSREVAERSYNLRRYTRPARGGHFPFFENTDSFSADVLAFFRDVHAA